MLTLQKETTLQFFYAPFCKNRTDKTAHTFSKKIYCYVLTYISIYFQLSASYFKIPKGFEIYLLDFRKPIGKNDCVPKFFYMRRKLLFFENLWFDPFHFALMCTKYISENYSSQ